MMHVNEFAYQNIQIYLSWFAPSLLSLYADALKVKKVDV